MTRDEVREELILDIHRAFAWVTREDGITMREAVAIDRYCSEEERADARALDTDRRWQDVEDYLIETHYTIFSYLDPKGLRYYLPATMCWVLRNLRSSSSPTIFSFLSALCYRGPDSEECSLLDGEQSRIVCRFLRFLAEYEGKHGESSTALQALLDGDWGRFCLDVPDPRAR